MGYHSAATSRPATMPAIDHFWEEAAPVAVTGWMVGDATWVLAAVDSAVEARDQYAELDAFGASVE